MPHPTSIWHEKLEKYISDLKGEDKVKTPEKLTHKYSE
jgi:hypothetical protein